MQNFYKCIMWFSFLSDMIVSQANENKKSCILYVFAIYFVLQVFQTLVLSLTSCVCLGLSTNCHLHKAKCWVREGVMYTQKDIERLGGTLGLRLRSQ